MPRRSIKGPAKAAIAADKAFRKTQQTEYQTKAADSYQNFAAAVGLGTNNLLSASSYSFDPITRIRVLLEWIHRGSWLGGVAVDKVADDMTRAGVQVKGELDPEAIQELDMEAQALGIWNSVNDTVKWGRLYGGAIGVHMVKGQALQTPLRIETVGKDQYRGIFPMDRWMVEPSLEDLVQDPGPFLGLPKYYRVTADAPAMMNQKIHYTRCFRMEGIRLPYWQRLMENLWSVSVIERLQDRMKSFDSATIGAAQLVFKAFIRTYKLKGFRELIAAGGPGYQALVKQVQFMRQTQSNEGVTLLDTEDEFDTHSAATGMAGIANVLDELGQQLAGALEMPLVVLFGQSPKGFSSGDTDVRMYYDGINQKQNRHLLHPMTQSYRMMAQSKGFKVPPNFGLVFRPLWQLTETEKATIAGTVMDYVTKGVDGGLLSDRAGMQELKQSSEVTNIGTNITQEDIDAADDKPAPKLEPIPGGGVGTEGDKQSQAAADKLAIDGAMVEGA